MLMYKRNNRHNRKNSRGDALEALGPADTPYLGTSYTLPLHTATWPNVLQGYSLNVTAVGN
jgi:hypothetical protein